MTRDDIRKMIQTYTPTENEKIFFGVVQRTFDELLKFDEQLMSSRYTEEDLQQLKNGNAKLEQDLFDVNAEIVRTENDASYARQEAQKSLYTLQQQCLELDHQIKELEGECDRIRQKLNNLPDKPAEMKLLKSKLNELQAKNSKLQAEQENLGEDYQANAELHHRLTAFVQKLEALEEQMTMIMKDIWNELPNDSFDKMYKL